MLDQTLRQRQIVRVDGIDRRQHQHDASGFLFVPFEYQSSIPSDAGYRVDWQVLRGQEKPRDAFVRIGTWPDIQYYVKLDSYEDHATYIDLCITADVDPLTQLEWADLLRRVKAAY